MTDHSPGAAGVDQRCYRHPEREAYISCQRCERPICPQCMREASVGFQCPSCVDEGAKSVRQPKNMAGGFVSSTVGRVSMVIIGINVVAYVLQIATGGSNGTVSLAGAMIAESGRGPDGQAVTGVLDGGYWRLVTAAFLHNSLLHLAFNMYALYLFGPFVERALGAWRFSVAYLTMAVFSSVVVFVLSDPRTLTVGASGAVFGLFGMALVLLLKQKQNVNSLLVLLALNVALSFRPGISWQGHLGGFVAGLLIAVAIAYVPRERRQIAQIAVLAVLLIGSVVAVVLRTAALTG